jgi:hypothetical protein
VAHRSVGHRRDPGDDRHIIPRSGRPTGSSLLLELPGHRDQRDERDQRHFEARSRAARPTPDVVHPPVDVAQHVAADVEHVPVLGAEQGIGAEQCRAEQRDLTCVDGLGHETIVRHPLVGRNHPIGVIPRITRRARCEWRLDGEGLESTTGTTMTTGSVESHRRRSASW